jgi:hypothetical protein
MLAAKHLHVDKARRRDPKFRRAKGGADGFNGGHDRYDSGVHGRPRGGVDERTCWKDGVKRTKYALVHRDPWVNEATHAINNPTDSLRVAGVDSAPRGGARPTEINCEVRAFSGDSHGDLIASIIIYTITVDI